MKPASLRLFSSRKSDKIDVESSCKLKSPRADSERIHRSESLPPPKINNQRLPPNSQDNDLASTKSSTDGKTHISRGSRTLTPTLLKNVFRGKDENEYSSPGKASSFRQMSEETFNVHELFHGDGSVRKLLGLKGRGVRSFLRKRIKGVEDESTMTKPIEGITDDLHLGVIAGLKCSCNHIEVENANSLRSTRNALPVDSSSCRIAKPRRGVLCHVLHRCALSNARPRSGSKLYVEDNPDELVLAKKCLCNSGSELGEEDEIFFDALDSDCNTSQAKANSGSWDVKFLYGESEYFLRVVDGIFHIPAACFVAEIIRTSIDIGVADVELSMDGLKLQDCITGETFCMLDDISRRDGAGRKFRLLYRQTLSHPGTPERYSKEPMWSQDESVADCHIKSSSDHRISMKSLNQSREFSMPNLRMEELNGADMISETLGRASIFVPLKMSAGAERFNCPATAIDKLELGGDPSNCWEEPPSETFLVRGKTYLKDGVKVPSEESAYMLLGVDLLLGADQLQHVAIREGGFVQRFKRNAGTKCPFILILNFTLPWGSFISYFAPRHGKPTPFVGDPVFDSLMKQIIDDDSQNEFRNNRLKIIPRCHDGPWLVRTTVGGKPAIIGTKIAQHYFKGDGYFEIVTDVCSSTAALYILGVVKNYTKIVSVDLGFVIQGDTEEELPERLIGAVRFHHLDVAGALSFDSWEGRAEENYHPKHNPNHM